jgi:4'-phosphopantetheinyl transferase
MQKDNWISPPDALNLEPDQVDIWRVFLGREADLVKVTESTLSVDESERADRFHFAADRHRFVVAHVALRNILSRYLNCKPEDLSFSVNQYGKPSLSDHKLEFNLTHSGDLALIAVTLERKVGVDVERIRSDMELESIASRYFSQGEVSEFLTLHPEQRVAGFFTCWTRKEAYIKAQGVGLSLPLESFDVSLIPNESAILRATRPDPQEAARWALLSLDVASGYASAVAVEGAALILSRGQDLDFRLWDWKTY